MLIPSSTNIGTLDNLFEKKLADDRNHYDYFRATSTDTVQFVALASYIPRLTIKLGIFFLTNSRLSPGISRDLREVSYTSSTGVYPVAFPCVFLMAIKVLRSYRPKSLGGCSPGVSNSVRRSDWPFCQAVPSWMICRQLKLIFNVLQNSINLLDLNWCLISEVNLVDTLNSDNKNEAFYHCLSVNRLEGKCFAHLVNRSIWIITCLLPVVDDGIGPKISVDQASNFEDGIIGINGALRGYVSFFYFWQISQLETTLYISLYMFGQ
ncbi:hypothetical protein RF11_15337 [Thelohanellus kitauei]|uniref:Uncharacterized protein n=1 Tax=Thelohanellus kitauei TaxID=669202 RepID=A0A0C2LZV7_THEKT|nr:hypothetical protein RF11_15337 [Thelohanellus kitauei]